MKKTNKLYKDYKFYLLVIYVVAAVIFVAQTFISKLLPLKYIAGITILLLLLGLAFYFLLFSRRVNKINRALGVFLTVVLSISMIVGNFYLYTTYSALGNMSTNEDKKVGVSIVVLKDSSYKKIDDLLGKTFGKATNLPDKNVDKTQETLMSTYNSDMEVTEYDNIGAFADALYNNEVDAIILNEASRGLFDEKHPEFDDETRVIKTYTYTEESTNIAKPVDVTNDPFVMYVSGIDTYGSLQTVSRTDVNMLLAVNPNTHQILIVSIPRDYYVPQTCQGNAKDKLTHTGIFGVDCSVSSLEQFFDLDINYYGRINFSSVVEIVDALGGVEINSPVAFTTLHGGYNIQQGLQHMDGSTALGFVRERYGLSGGDNDRVKNQARLISAIVDKITSPAVLTNYMGLMSSVGDAIQLNMTTDEISSLVHMQIDTMSKWEISQFSLSGKGETNWSPANGFNSYVMIPDTTSVEQAKTYIMKVLSGEKVQVNEL
ncbi:transcriptional regulator [Erysipelotrichaceae bacterium MTC7]|nr:transcriptional regulator [Erysipelotrichaceae bacterium MTC7]